MSYPSFNVVTSKHTCSFIGGVEVFDIRGEGIPAATYLRGSYHHLITIRVYGFVMPQILFPCSQTQFYYRRFLFYRGGYLFIDQDLQHPTPIPSWIPHILLEVKLLRSPLFVPSKTLNDGYRYTP